MVNDISQLIIFLFFHESTCRSFNPRSEKYAFLFVMYRIWCLFFVLILTKLHILPSNSNMNCSLFYTHLFSYENIMHVCRFEFFLENLLSKYSDFAAHKFLSILNLCKCDSLPVGCGTQVLWQLWAACSLGACMTPENQDRIIHFKNQDKTHMENQDIVLIYS